MAVEIGGRKTTGLYLGSKPVEMLYGGTQPVWPPQGARPSAPQSVLQLNGPLMFDADYGKNGLGDYKNLHPINGPAGSIEQGLDIGVCLDPIDQSRTVLWSDSTRGMHSGNNHPRSQAEGPFFIKPKKWDNNDSRYAWYTETLVPSKYAMKSGAEWTGIGSGAHGAPWTTGSATGLMLTYLNGKHILRMHDTPSWLGPNVEYPLGQWVGLLIYTRYEHQVDGGFIEMAINRTSDMRTGWEQVPINGVKRYATDVISDGEGNGWWKDPSIAPASPRVGLYGDYRARMFYAHHRIGRAPKDVLPAGWDGKISGETFVEASA